MANGIKKWALTTSWKALHEGDGSFCICSEKCFFFFFPGRVNERRRRGAAGGGPGGFRGRLRAL